MFSLTASVYHAGGFPALSQEQPSVYILPPYMNFRRRLDAQLDLPALDSGHDDANTLPCPGVSDN